MKSKKLRAAEQDIDTIRLSSLLEENEYLSRLVMDHTSLPINLRDDFHTAIFSDLIKGTAQQRWRFLKRVSKEVGWFFSGKRPPYYIPFVGTRSYLLESVRDHAWLTRLEQAKKNANQKAEYERFQKIWEKFVAKFDRKSYLRKLRPHAGKRGKLRVFIFCGGGGLGDAILYAPLLAALKEKLADCEITLACPPAGKEFYARSKVVNCVISAEWTKTIQAMEAAAHMDLFDLVIFSRCFIPIFQTCERTRITDPQILDWIHTQQKTARMLEQFSTNLGISILDRMLNVHYLDFFGMVTGLPISAYSPIGFTPNPAARLSVKKLRLPKRYVTVRDGANAGDMAFAKDMERSRTNKQLSPKKWKEVLSWLKSQDIKTVQVGGREDNLIPCVDYDLRGRTSLSELCFVMKSAITHIDTEGGLAHFARAIEQPAVIFFPTTSASFFGYPQNVNIVSRSCGRCWYATDTWLASCPRGTRGPECVETMDIGPLKTFVLERTCATRREKKIKGRRNEKHWSRNIMQ